MEGTIRQFKILALAGDGVGPEIMGEALRLLEGIEQSLEFVIDVQEDLLHGQAWDKYGTFCRDETVTAAKSSDAVLVGAVGGEKWDNIFPEGKPEEKDGLMRLRKELGVFAGLRPAWASKYLNSITSFKADYIKGLNILVLRELCGGTFFSSPRGVKTIGNGKQIGIDTTTYNTDEIVRHSKVGFELARQRQKNLVSVDKANVMESGVLWRKVVTDVSKEYPDVDLRHLYADNCIYQLAKNPTQFDVILTDNLFGDLLSDLAGALTGSLGMLPSASLAGLSNGSSIDAPGIYEPVHGTAPDIAGQGIVNPIGMFLSIGMMFEYGFGYPGVAFKLKSSVDTALSKGVRTRDIGGNASTREMTDAVIQAWKG